MMKHVFRTLSAAVLALTMTLSLAACGSQTGGEDDSAPLLIGISQYGQHASLDNCREGFLQGLAEAGLEEGVDFTVDYRNASANDNANAQIGDAFSAANVDLMVGIATPSAIA